MVEEASTREDNRVAIEEDRMACIVNVSFIVVK